MAITYSVSLDKIIKEFAFDVLYMPKDPSEIRVISPDTNRPGLIFSGFENFFDPNRLQFIGKSELDFVNQKDEAMRRYRIDLFMQKRPVAVIITRGAMPPPVLLELAEQYAVPVLLTTDTTSRCMSDVVTFLNVELAERITRHGVFVEIYGEGVLIIGDSGVGKSETAVELIKRGHRLIADDAVEIKKINAKTIVGSSPDNIRHFIELRGIGIINARRIFGMGAVKMSDKIDLVIKLEPWDSTRVYDRLGAESDTIEILGIHIPFTTVPVHPGRNLAIILEVAAMNNRQKKMGFNAARELMHNLGMIEDADADDDEIELWNKY